MLNHTYTSVRNANLVDFGKKQHISSQPSPLLKDNFLGEFRTELDKKKVLSNLGIATELSLEWEYIKGDIGRSSALIQELDSRTKYISEIDGFQKSVINGIKYLETIVGGEQESETKQDWRLETLEESTLQLNTSLEELKNYLEKNVNLDISNLKEKLENITKKVDNITELIQVSNKRDNAITLLSKDLLEDGETPGLYVPDLSKEVSTTTQNVLLLQTNVENILNTYVTKDLLGGLDFDFVNQGEFDSYVNETKKTIQNINEELTNTVKTGEDGHVDTLYVNTISKNNDNGNIKITDSFEVTEGIPLDIRFVVDTLDDLLSLPVRVCYSGMGVIVNSLSSLYILRKPTTSLTLEYISNVFNWKCPEDLVTVALSREEYDNLEEINPNVFYYIYEDEIIRTLEPKLEDFESEEEYNVAFLEWVDSLKTLSQEYMSASWGVDIENKLSQKASNESVAILVLEINDIKGNKSGTSLSSLSEQVTELQNKSEIITNRVDEILIKNDDVEQGRLIDAEQEIESIKSNLDNYVTKEYIQDSSKNFIFVKNEDYLSDKISFEEALATELNTSRISLSETVVISENNRLKQNNSIIANIEDVPQIEVLSQNDYDNLLEKNNDTYYYTFDEDDRYVMQSELITKLATIQSQIDTLLNKITSLEKTIEDLLNNSKE